MTCGSSSFRGWVARGPMRTLPEDVQKVNGLCPWWRCGWDRLQGRGMKSQCFPNNTFYTRQFKKVPTLALALNCSCSALEFKWPACGFRPPLPVPLSFSWPLVVLLCSIPYGFPLTFLQSSLSFSLYQSLAYKHLKWKKPTVLIWL